jgi:hypothetical protein
MALFMQMTYYKYEASKTITFKVIGNNKFQDKARRLPNEAAAVDASGQ